MSNRRGWRSGSKPLGRLILILLLAWVIPAFGIVFAIPSPAIAAGDEWNQPIDREWDQAIMPGWGREVQRWYITYGWDDSWPADFEGRVEVTDVAIESQRPADGVTGDVIFLEKEYANDDETSDDFWWYYEGLNYGGATLRVTYTDPFGVAQSYTFDVIVDSDVYELDAWVEDGSFNALPGATKQLGAWGIHKRQDQPDTQEGLTYQWSIVDGQEFATIEGQGEDATLSLKPYEGDDPFWQEHVQVQVTLFDGGTEVARYDDLHVTVAALYGEIWPRVLDRLNVGESVTITPELRSYAIEHLDTGGYITLPTKDGFRCDGYDNEALSVTDNGDGSLTIKRLAPWGTYLPLECTWVNPEGEDVGFSDGIFLFDLNFDMWLDYEHDDVYSDGSLDLTIGSNGLEGADYTLEVTVGDWEGDGWACTYAEGSDFTVQDNTITLDGKKLRDAGAENIRVLVRAMAGDIELCQTDAWVTVQDAYEDYDRPWNEGVLPGWVGTIDQEYNVDVRSSEFPDGYPGGAYQVQDVVISAQRPWQENEGGEVLTLERVGNESSYHWDWEAVGYGEADLTASYTDIHGNPQSWTITIYVGHDVYGLDVWSETGEWQGFPGASFILHCNGWHDSDQEGEPEEFTYEWFLDQGIQGWATLEQVPGDPQTAIVTFKDVPDAERGFWQDMDVSVTLLVDGEERAQEWRHLHMATDYMELYPKQVDRNLAVAGTVTIYPELRHYAIDLDGGYEVIESANMRIDCEEGSFEVTHNGNGSITLKRLAPWHTWFALHATVDDGFGEQDFWNNYDFDFIGRWMFSDVDINTPHVSDILWLANAGITTGWKMPDGNIEFRGMSPVVRQDMAAFLYRLAGSPQYVPTPQDVETFRDVNSKTPHATEIWWLASTGISKGWDMHDGTFEFRGTSTVVRQDMAAFLRRLTKWMGGDDSLPENVVNPFRDVTDGTAHREAIIWLASTGVTTGWTEPDGSKTYRGMSPVVRQDMAAFLHRLDTYIRDHPNVQIDYS